MCLKKSTRLLFLLTALSVLGGCGALDSVLPSTGTYKINAKINDASLDDLSILTSKDKIQPFFEEPVSEDQDITELVVFLKDSRGITTGYKVTYSLTYNNKKDETGLQTGQDNTKTEKQDEKKKDKDEVFSAGSGENKEDKKKDDVVVTGTDKSKEDKDEKKKDDSVVAETDKNKEDKDKKESSVKSSEEKKEPSTENTDALEKIEHIKKGNEIIFPVKSLDENMPFIPLPSDLPIGKYTLVFQVMGKNTVLYKYEKPLFYIADAEFSFEGIQIHLPGIAENSQFIQNGNVILLDTKLNFDSRLDPYIVWYNGKKIIDEGRYSDGAGTLLWKAPEQNGFVSLRAEVFPFWERTGLTGHQKRISLLVSSKEIDMHLLSKDTPNLVRWYTFEGDLTDSLMKDSEEQGIKSEEKNKFIWLPSNGTYGLASGTDKVYKLPNISFTNDENENWQIVSRFKPLNEGEIFSVQFGPAFDVTMTLSNKKANLTLTLASASKTSSEVLKLPNEKDSFVTVSIKFFIQSGRLYAKMALGKPALRKDFDNKKELIINPISMEINLDMKDDLDKEFKIMLGQQQKNNADNKQTAVVQKPAYTALWDELAVLRFLTANITIKDDTKVEETADTKSEPPEIITPPPR